MSEDFGVEWSVSADNALSTRRDGNDGFISVQVSLQGGPAGQLLADSPLRSCRASRAEGPDDLL